jgi:hypothetical protein
LIAHLLVTLAKLARPGGLGAAAAESLAVTSSNWTNQSTPLALEICRSVTCLRRIFLIRRPQLLQYARTQRPHYDRRLHRPKCATAAPKPLCIVALSMRLLQVSLTFMPLSRRANFSEPNYDPPADKKLKRSETIESFISFFWSLDLWQLARHVGCARTLQLYPRR